MTNAKEALPTLYLETSVPSYYVARPSTDTIILAHQQITQQWWEKRLHEYDVYVSGIVLAEIGRGDVGAALRRLEVIARFPVLDATPEVEALTQLYMKKLLMPREAEADALHVALASVHGIEYLVTWNCRHIARASMIRALPEVNAGAGYDTPTICTPEELLYEIQDEYVD